MLPEHALNPAVEGSWALNSELDRWLDPAVPPKELDALLLARLVTREVRRVGKHFLAADRLERLAAVRQRHAGHDAYLDGFLDCILDKHDGRFWNRTYLFLPVIEVVMADHELPASDMAALLAADVVRHELGTARSRSDVSPLGRPDPRTLQTRVRHSLRFMTAHLGDPASTGLLAVAHEPGSVLTDLLLELPATRSRRAGEWLELTAQPVSTVHDEYFFLRVLQAHEMGFAGMNQRLRPAIAAVRDQHYGLVVRLLQEVVAFMDRHASLFRIVATMRPEAFHTFREFTDGASAIQSEEYKRFEGLCGRPPVSRLGSPAFDNVPAVRAEVTAGQDTMTAAFIDACAADSHMPAIEVIADLLRTLEESHRRWKSTHVTLATRMLGDARGSGYTAGVPYLSAWVDHRLFWALPVLAGPARPAQR